MLPQGDFAAFLRADAKTRAELLQKLFGTTRFENIEAQLKADLTAAEQELNAARAESEHVMRRARDEMERWAEDAAAEAEDAAGDAGADHPESSEAAGVEDFRRMLAARTEAARGEHAALAAALREAEHTRADVEARRTRGIAREQLERDEQAYARRRDEIEPVRHALERHLRAESLSGFVRAADTAQERLGLRETAAGEARDALLGDAHSPAFGLTETVMAEGDPAPVLLAAEDRLTAELGAAEAAQAEEERIGDLEAELVDASKRAATSRAAAAAAEAAGEELRTEETELTRQLDSLREKASRQEFARNGLERARALTRAISQYAEASAAAAASGAEAARLRGSYQDRRQAWQDLQQRRLDQAAAELAGRLEDGQGCPVCGSSEHPAPAALPDGESAVTKQDEDNARRLTEDAESAYEAARVQADQDSRSVAELRIQGGDRDPKTAKAEEDAAQSALAAASAAAEELDTAVVRCAELSRERSDLAEQAAAALVAAAQADEQRLSAQRRIAELSGRVQAARDGFTTLADRVDCLAGLRTLVSAARRSFAELQTARENAAEARGDLADRLGDSDFDTVQDVRDALLETDTAANAKQAVARYDEEGQRLVLRREAEDSAADVDGDGEPLPVPDEQDLALASDAAAAARMRLTECSVQLGLLEASTKALQSYGLELAAASERIRPLEERYNLLRSVTDTARGSGERLQNDAEHVCAGRTAGTGGRGRH